MVANSEPASAIGVFLAHSLALELDAAQRYAGLADAADTLGALDVAALFRDLGYHSHRHAADIREIAKNFGGIPVIPPWQYEWYDRMVHAPEAIVQPTDVQSFTLEGALKLALEAEQQAHGYYATMARDTNDPDIARLAQEFADEEAEHVALVQSWLDRSRS